jgi:hypothetical protein
LNVGKEKEINKNLVDISVLLFCLLRKIESKEEKECSS